MFYVFYFNPFSNNRDRPILNYSPNIKLHGLYDNILEDEDGNLFIVFLNASVLSVVAHI